MEMAVVKFIDIAKYLFNSKCHEVQIFSTYIPNAKTPKAPKRQE